MRVGRTAGADASAEGADAAACGADAEGCAATEDAAPEDAAPVDAGAGLFSAVLLHPARIRVRGGDIGS